MLHLIWYIIVGLIAGFVAKSLMHTHLTLLWTIVLGIVGSIIGGAVTHLFFTAKWRRPVPSCGINCVHTRSDSGLISLAPVQVATAPRVEFRSNG